MTLSICIIFHNQKDFIQRCLDSVFAQKMNFDYEILLGDDNSTDGTWEELKKYELNYPTLIKTYRINSDDFSPVSNSQRSGINRSNVYIHAKGKYITFIDGDDFILDDTRYQQQVELLEANPSCSICSGNTALYQDGKKPELLSVMIPEGRFNTGTKITQKQFFNLFFHNSTCVMRRRENILNEFKRELLVDFQMTLFHLNFGDMIYIDNVYLAYIQQSNGIYTSISKYRKFIGSITETANLLLYFPVLKKEIIADFAHSIFYLIGSKECSNLTDEDKTKLLYVSDRLYRQIYIKKNKNTLFKFTINFLYLTHRLLAKIKIDKIVSVYPLVYSLCKVKKQKKEISN